MKKLVFLIAFIGFALFFNACAPGYVATQPTEREMTRPARPNGNYVWINGEWVWQRQTRTYIQRNGVWAAPNRGRSYTPGHWNSTPRGHQWRKGYWR